MGFARADRGYGVMHTAKHRIVDEPPETQARWVLTFNDIMTLLLTFFVLVLSMSSINTRALQSAHRMIVGELGGSAITSSNASGSDAMPAVIETPHIFAKQPYDSVRGGLRRESDDATINALAELLQELFHVPVFDAGGDRFQETAVPGMTHKYRGVIDDRYFEPGIALVREKRGVVLRLPAGVLFDSGDAVLKQSAYGILGTVAKALQRADLQVSIEGHTDAVPVATALYASNWELSVMRAVNTAQYFIELHRINPARICVAGYADTVPIAANDSPQHRELNRRVEIVFMR